MNRRVGKIIQSVAILAAATKNIIDGIASFVVVWTRLGYTYDWANNGTEYGLAEFLVEADTSVQVSLTKTTTDFLAWLEEGAAVDKIA